MKILFAEQLSKLRKEKGLSQDDLAEKLFVTRQAISTWEKGDVQPSLNTIESLAEVLEVPVEKLLFGQEDRNSLIHKKLDRFLTEDDVDKDWQYNHIDNGWEFIARYYWILFGLIAMLAWAFGRVN